MQIGQISKQDALMAATIAQVLAVSDRLLDALGLAGLPVSGPGLDGRKEAAKWFQAVCLEMARQLEGQKQQAAAESTSMRIKSAGPLAPPAPSTPARKSRGSKRKT